MDTTRSAKKVIPPRYWIVGGIFLVLAVGTSAWFFWPTSTTTIAPIQVQSGPLAESVPVNAVLTPSRAGAISTITGGTVVEVIAYAGQQVKAGDSLLKLTNADFERQLAEVQSELAGAKADLTSAQADAIDQANSLRMAQINATNAVRIANLQLEAERKLQPQGIISLLTLKKTEADRDGKVAEFNYARQHVALAHAATQAKINAAQERAAVLQSRADSLTASVDALTLKAPFDGVVAKIDGKLGAAVAPGAQLAEVITPDLQINLEVAEQFASAVHPSQTLRLEGGLTGTVVSISPTAEGGIVKGRASINGDTKKLRSNTTLPGEAILAEHGVGLFVQVDGVNLSNRTIDATVQTPDGSAHNRHIHFGARYRQKVVVLSGAAAGEQIVALDAGASK